MGMVRLQFVATINVGNMKNSKEYFKEKDDEQVKDLFLSCYDSVINADCFSSRDVTLLHFSEAELNRRGYEITESSQPVISKKEKQ